MAEPRRRPQTGAADPGRGLEIVGVGLAYGGLRALASVDLTVAPGEVTGLIGPNGAGKSSLFDVACGLIRPDAGSVLLHGRDVTRLRPAARARLGLGRTFQRLELFGSLSVGENVAVAEEAAHRYHVAARRQRFVASGLASAVRYLERVGLAEEAATRADVLPTGKARLVEVARALAAEPSVLLLDEPASGLDPTETDRLADVLVGLTAEGMAVLLVEHDVELVMRVCRTVVVLDRGSVLAVGSPAAVRGDEAVRDAYLGQLAVS